jgi:hypothetical protein
MYLVTAYDSIQWLKYQGYIEAALALEEELLKHELDSVPCNCLLNEDGENVEDTCVFDDSSLAISDCTIAEDLFANGKCKTNCPHYKNLNERISRKRLPTNL